MMGSEIDALTRHIARRLGTDAPWVALGGGTVNTTFRVDAGVPLVVRIGPDAETLSAGPSWLRPHALACEQHLLHLVRSVVLQVPGTVAAGFASRSWVAQTLVPGRMLADVLPSLDRGDRAGIWRDLGSILRRLHVVPAPWFGTPDGRQRFPDWPAMLVHDAAGMVDDAIQMGLPVAPLRTLADAIEGHRATLAAVTAPRPIHSDLGPHHVFVDRAADGWRISGMIDWEYGRYGDPLSEGLLLDLLDRADDDLDREAFLEGYGDAPDDGDADARRWLYRGVALGWAATDAVRRGDPDRASAAVAQLAAWEDASARVAPPRRGRGPRHTGLNGRTTFRRRPRPRRVLVPTIPVSGQ